ncbi:DUF6809 family protein [Paenibacillus sp. HW567]|uniref:DUF6809 family protein n=1 Tax=Paenibacillus sp. HW567 TaxID=1034769 RepID=UPI00035C38DE|nr:DUF6809 family protein [Paenibacillus sp. HW567]
MRSILEDFYYGKVQPDESTNPNDPKARQMNREVSDLMLKYQKNLPQAEFEQLEKLLDLVGELNSMHAAAAFINGYRTGALMMIEVFSEEKETGPK